MPRHAQEVHVYTNSESDSSEYGTPIQVERTQPRLGRLSSDHGSYKSKRTRGSSPAPIVVENYLNVPQGRRQRASSTGGAPQPTVIPIYLPPSSRSASRERRRDSSESDGSYRSHSRGRRPSSHRGSLAYEAQQLAKMKMIDNDKARELIILEHEEKQRKQKEREKALLIEAEAKRKKEEDDEKARRAQILLEEKDRQEKKKKDDEELRKKILREEEERKDKEKAAKKKEEDEFQQKVKERFMKAGYDPEYIEAILDEKKKERRRLSRQDELAIDLSRPTYIRVQRKHLYPDTLDVYDLPWEYDSADSRYIIIKKYISHDLQQELFEHTRKIKIRKEQKLITDGYTKETITTLKPGIVRDSSNKDEMYLVRRKSSTKGDRSRSRSVSRRSWMFT